MARSMSPSSARVNSAAICRKSLGYSMGAARTDCSVITHALQRGGALFVEGGILALTDGSTITRCSAEGAGVRGASSPSSPAWASNEITSLHSGWRSTPLIRRNCNRYQSQRDFCNLFTCKPPASFGWSGVKSSSANTACRMEPFSLKAASSSAPTTAA